MDATSPEGLNQESVNLGDEEYKELLDEIKELEELKKTKVFLEKEDIDLKSEADALQSELDGIKIAIKSSESYAKSYQDSQKISLENVETFEQRRENLIVEINELQVKLNSVKENMGSIGNLNDNLQGEIHDINNEKTLVMQRLSAVQSGLHKIGEDKNERMPNLKWYDSVLKQVYSILKETQNRMDVSIMLNK